MKLVQTLASIVTGFAILATVGNASASAAEFDLSGKFVSSGAPAGTFDGTFSYSGGVVPDNASKPLSSWSINVFNTSNTLIDTFSSSVPGNFGDIYGATSTSNANFLEFQNNVNNTGLDLSFPTSFQGTGSLAFNSSPSVYTTPTSGNFTVISAKSSPISQSVPEPSTIAGTIAAGAVLMAARLKKQKALQAA